VSRGTSTRPARTLQNDVEAGHTVSEVSRLSSPDMQGTPRNVSVMKSSPIAQQHRAAVDRRPAGQARDGSRRRGLRGFSSKYR
jgi:hypothetical protein